MDNTDSNFIFWQCLIRPINYPWAAPRRMVRAGSPWHQKLLMTIRAAHHPADYREYFVLNFYPDFWKVLTVDPSYFFFLLTRQGILRLLLSDNVHSEATKWVLYWTSPCVQARAPGVAGIMTASCAGPPLPPTPWPPCPAPPSRSWPRRVTQVIMFKRVAKSVHSKQTSLFFFS